MLGISGRIMNRFAVATTLLFVTTLALAAEAVRATPESTYTLYRSSATTDGANMRIHVATFDAMDGPTYNRDNCEIAKTLFQGQSGVTVTYWCERGYFSKK
jgi:hypothetical protein